MEEEGRKVYRSADTYNRGGEIPRDARSPTYHVHVQLFGKERLILLRSCIYHT